MCYQKQLIRLLKLRNFKLHLAAKVAFMLNKDFEIVVLRANTKTNKLENYIKSRLNYSL